MNFPYRVSVVVESAVRAAAWGDPAGSLASAANSALPATESVTDPFGDWIRESENFTAVRGVMTPVNRSVRISSSWYLSSWAWPAGV